MPEGKEDKYGGYFAATDSIYNIIADPKKDVYGKDFPEVSMFDEEGGYSSGYTEAMKGAGMKLTTSGVGGLTPRRAHLDMELAKSKSLLPDDRDIQMDVLDAESSVSLAYGNKPRYNKKGTLISPSTMAQFYIDKAPKDPFEKMDWGQGFSGYIKSMSTDRPQVEDKIMNSMVEEKPVIPK